MSNAIGSPIDTSLVQAAQAQDTASRARDRQRAAEDRTQRYIDQLELRVAALESAEALRQLPRNDSEQAEAERHAKDGGTASGSDDEQRPHIDVTA